MKGYLPSRCGHHGAGLAGSGQVKPGHHSELSLHQSTMESLRGMLMLEMMEMLEKLGQMEIMAELWICGRRDEPMT
jgi:hypothetical protein